MAVISKAIPKTYDPKPVPDFGTTPGAFPYTSVEAQISVDAKWGQAYEVRSSKDGYDGGNGYVDKIAVNKDTDTVSIFEAYNKNDQPPLGQKLFLSDIMMSVFKQTGKNPTDLKAVHVDTVINEESDDLFEDIFGALGKNRREESVTFQTSAIGPEKDNFNKIAGSPFGLAIDRANQQFSTGKTVQSYTLSPNEEISSYNDLDVVLG